MLASDAVSWCVNVIRLFLRQLVGCSIRNIPIVQSRRWMHIVSDPLQYRHKQHERERESRLPGRNSRELQPQHHIRHNTSFQREAATGGPLHTNLGCNIYKLRESFPHQTIHSLHLPQKVPLPLAKLHPHPTPNKPRLFSFILTYLLHGAESLRS